MLGKLEAGNLWIIQSQNNMLHLKEYHKLTDEDGGMGGMGGKWYRMAAWT